MHYILTCIGPKLSPSFVKALTGFLLEKKITVQKTKRLAQKEVACIEMALTTETRLNRRSLMKNLSFQNKIPGIDLIVQTQKAYAEKKRLVVLDLDSTLIQAEGLDEMAKEIGVGDKVAIITRRTMNGEIPFREALRERVRLLKGLSIRALYRVYKRIVLTPGTFEFISILKKRQIKTAVLTGGFDYFASRFQKTLGLDYAFSNHFEIRDNRLTGEVLGEIVDGQKKLFFMEEIAKKEGIPLHQVVAVGDGANDLPMMKRAGLGIAFNAKPAVREASPYHLTQKSLTCILYLFGISEKEI